MNGRLSEKNQMVKQIHSIYQHMAKLGKISRNFLNGNGVKYLLSYCYTQQF